MRKIEERRSWIFRGGSIGIASLILLLLPVHGYMALFYPRPLPTSPQDLLPFILIFCVPCGFIVGAFLGYELAPLSKIERKQFAFDGFIGVAIWLLTKFASQTIFGKADAQQNFLHALFIESLPLAPVGLYYHCLRHKLKKWRP